MASLAKYWPPRIDALAFKVFEITAVRVSLKFFASLHSTVHEDEGSAVNIFSKLTHFNEKPSIT